MTSIYIWQYADNLKDRDGDWSCRDTGGITVVAQSLEHARSLIETAFPGSTASYQEPIVFELARETDPMMWVFPDFGCC